MNRWFAPVLLMPLLVAAQQAPPDTAPAPGQAASVRFSFDWPQGIPWQKYSIDVQADGKAHFDGVPNAADSRDTDPYRQDFSMSAANRQKIFDLTQKLNYFRGDFDSHLKHIAQTGRKTLEYRSAQVQGATTYNWSQNADVEELTKLFQAIAMTIDYGRKLEFQYRFDKLGMDERLKELQDLQASQDAKEIGIIAPILRKIAGDPNMMNISRQTAKHLLQTRNDSASAGQNPAQQ
ncbi:MAG: hypothetical protein WCC87_19705 [Candidatus Korobacteraceae bacterium]